MYFSEQAQDFRKWLIFCYNSRPSGIIAPFITGIKAETKFCCIVKFGPFNWKNLNDQETMCFYSDMFYDRAVKSSQIDLPQACIVSDGNRTRF